MNTQPLIVVLPVHGGDVDRAETLLKWVAELGHVEEHNLLIAADSELPQPRVKALLDIVRPCFSSVRAMLIPVGAKGWPLAANLVFRAVARQIGQTYKLPWMWMESDAVPLRASWLEQIAEAYWHSPRPLLGCVLDAEKQVEGLPARYVSAIGVYPQNLYELLDQRWNDPRFTGPVNTKLSLAARTKDVRAFDMVFADEFVPRAHHTPLIQNFWGSDYQTPPLFVTARTEADPPNAVTLDFVRRDAVVFHRVKEVDAFLTMWRVRLEHLKALVVEAVHRETGEASQTLDVALGAAAELEVPAELPAPPEQVATPAPAPGEPPIGFKGAGEAATNWKGGPAAERERRRLRAQESREYLAEAKRKAQEAARAKQQLEPASV